MLVAVTSQHRLDSKPYKELILFQAEGEGRALHLLTTGLLAL